MDKDKRNLLIGIALLALGALSLLDNLNILFIEPDIFVGALFLAGGAFFLDRFRTSEQVKFLVFAAALGYIGLVIFIGKISGLDDNWEGVLLFLGVAGVAGFAYSKNQAKWGLVIVAGIALTLATIVSLDTIWWLHDELTGSVFFLGLGLTFAFLHRIRNAENNLDWAKYPAISLIFLAAFLLLVNVNHSISRFVFPSLLIATGVWLVVWGAKKTQNSN